MDLNEYLRKINQNKFFYINYKYYIYKVNKDKESKNNKMTTTGYDGERLNLHQTVRIVSHCDTRGLEKGELIWISEDRQSVKVKFYSDSKVENFYHNCLSQRLS